MAQLSESFVSTAWMERAACRVHDPELWFPSDGLELDYAVRVCSSCPVMVECRGFAVRTRQRFGVWAGLYFGDVNVRRRVRR